MSTGAGMVWLFWCVASGAHSLHARVPLRRINKAERGNEEHGRIKFKVKQENRCEIDKYVSTSVEEQKNESNAECRICLMAGAMKRHREKKERRRSEGYED